MSHSPDPAVSIVIATFNRAPVLRLALESVRRQTFTDWEALVIGDGCTDDSAGVVESMGDPRYRWHNLPKNTGSQSEPNNTGLAMARGRRVAYLGHDDLWFPWHLQLLVETLDAEAADFGHALVAYFRETGLVGCWGAPADGTTYGEQSIPPSGWLHRRDLAAEVGGWADPLTVDLWIDFHLIRRMAQSGAKFAYQPRLSVLKFPAVQFTRVYRNEQVPPQAALLRLMVLHSEGLEVALLEELANRLGRLQHEMAAQRVTEMVAASGSAESLQRFQTARQSLREKKGLGDDRAEKRPVRPPTLTAISPDDVIAGTPFNVQPDGESGISVNCRGATPETFVLLDGTPLTSCVVSPELVTASVPQALYAQPGTRPLVLINRAGVSNPRAFVTCPSDAPGS